MIRTEEIIRKKLNALLKNQKLREANRNITCDKCGQGIPFHSSESIFSSICLTERISTLKWVLKEYAELAEYCA